MQPENGFALTNYLLPAGIISEYKRTVFVLKNNQLLPFERNRYYVGKLLTSADFLVEQVYGNQKRRFLNELMYGSGIVCGLGVYSLDDLSIMVESGVAIDGWGREIVVENSVMKKLSAIDGFDTLQTSRAVLCLRYEEEQVHPVYAISGGEQGESYEYNRVRESYTLCLKDRDSIAPEEPSFAAFLGSALLYEDSDYSVSVSIPSTVSCGQPVRLTVTATQLSAGAGPLSLSAPLQTPSLVCADGTHLLNISFDEALPGEGASVTQEYWLTARSVATSDSNVMCPADGITVRVGGMTRTASEAFMLKVSVSELSPEDIVSKAIGCISLEEQALDTHSEYIELAEFLLQRTKSAYLIESVREDGVKRYLRTNAATDKRSEYRRWFRSSECCAAPAKTSDSTQSAAAPVSAFREPTYATGVCEIPLPTNLKAGQVVYSDEIVHGLGKGLVYVTTGLEYFAEDKKLGSTARNTIYGNPKFFPEEEQAAPACTAAVKVMNDRGSFVIAVKVETATPLVVLNVRWNAFSFPVNEESGKLQRMEGKSIAAVRPTVVMATRESHYFSVNFKNMEPCTLTYELTDRDSGTITSDGIYTAPGKEGIYEIRISCADMPLITTYAYAVVKKKGTETPEEAAAQ